MVFARGLDDAAPVPFRLLAALFAVEFFLTRPPPVVDVPLTLSRLAALGRDDVVLVICSFC